MPIAKPCDDYKPKRTGRPVEQAQIRTVIKPELTGLLSLIFIYLIDGKRLQSLIGQNAGHDSLVRVLWEPELEPGP